MALPIDILSFNIRYGTAPDGANHWDVRRDAVVAAIAASGSPLICLQEALLFQHRYILAMLGADWAGIFVGRDDGGDRGEGCAILFVKAQLYCTGAPQTIWLSETPDRPSCFGGPGGLPRVATRAHFLHLSSGRGFHVINTHFDHLSAAARSKSSELLLSRLPMGEDPIIVAGDFNAPPSEECMTRLFHGGLLDVLTTAHPAAASSPTFHGWSGTAASGAFSHIDYIMIQADLLRRGAVKVHLAEIVTERYAGRWPSDHFPVHVRLTFGPHRPPLHVNLLTMDLRNQRFDVDDEAAGAGVAAAFHRRVRPWSAGSWLGILNGVADTIVGSGADAVCLQHCDGIAHDFLRGALPAHTWALMQSTVGTCAIAFRFDQLFCASTSSDVLTRDGDAVVQRATFVWLPSSPDPDKRRTFHLLNATLGGAPATRIDAAGKLLATIRPSGDSPVLLCADLGAAVPALAAAGFVDIGACAVDAHAEPDGGTVHADEDVVAAAGRLLSWHGTAERGGDSSGGAAGGAGAAATTAAAAATWGMECEVEAAHIGRTIPRGAPRAAEAAAAAPVRTAVDARLAYS